MASAVIAVASAVSSAAVGAAVSLGASLAVQVAVSNFAVAATSFIIKGGISAGISAALSGSKKKSERQSISSTGAGNSFTVRQTDAPRQLIYGRQRVSGPLALLHSSTPFLHMVVMLASHEIEEIEEVYFEDEYVPLDSDGNAKGRYEDHVKIIKHLGSSTQTADSDLMSDLPGIWESSDRLRGIAYIYVRLKKSATLFQNGQPPNISAVIKGKKLFDTRTSVTEYSDNSALIVRDFLVNTDWYGLAIPTADVPVSIMDTAADVCDESETINKAYTTELPDDITASTELNASSKAWFVADNKSNSIWIAFTSGTEHVQFQYTAAVAIERLRLTATEPGNGGGAPKDWTLEASNTGAFAGEETVIDTQTSITWNSGEEKVFSFTNGSTFSYYRLIITSNTSLPNHSLANMMLFSSATSENRYTCNGTIPTSVTPFDIISGLLTSMAGKLIWSSGEWNLLAGKYVTPTLSFNEDNLRGTLTSSLVTSAKDRINRVRGLYISEENGWNSTDFPPVKNSTFLTNDNSVEHWKDVEYLFTTSAATAQRLAKIDMEDSRLEETVTIPMNLSGLALRCGDIFQLTNTKWGITDKEYIVVTMSITNEFDNDGNIIPGVNIVAKETASGIFTWSAEETTVDLASGTMLRSPSIVDVPENLQAFSGTQYILFGPSGDIIPRTKVTWDSLSDDLVFNGGFIEIWAKRINTLTASGTPLVAESDFIMRARVRGDQVEVFLNDLIETGIYEIKIRAINSRDIQGAFTSTVSHTVLGKLAPPEDVTGFFVGQNGDVVNFVWKGVSDFDLQGYEIRYAPVGGVNWKDATPLIEISSGKSVATIDARPGNWKFFIKAIDTSGVYSESATVKTVNIGNNNEIIKTNIITDFIGETLENFVVNHNGHAIPDSQTTAGDATEEQLFGTWIFDPFPTCKITTTTDIDIDFNDDARVWAVIESQLGPGVSEGVADPEFQLKHRNSSQSSASSTTAVVNISSLGTFTNCVLNHNNNILPDSQILASVATEAQLFDTWIHDPFTSWSYEAPEINIGSDSTFTFDSSWNEQLGPGVVSGAVNGVLTIDTRLNAGSYDGFEEWDGSRIEAQFMKMKLTFDTSNGLTYAGNWLTNVDTFQPWTIGSVQGSQFFGGRIVLDTTLGVAYIRRLDFVVDIDEQSERQESKTIAVSGTSFTFTDRFHATPKITITPISATAVLPIITAQSTTGFTVKVFDTVPADVGGVVNWSAEGV